MAWLIFAGYVIMAFLVVRPAAWKFARWDNPGYGKPAKMSGEDWIPVCLMAAFWPFTVTYWAGGFLLRRNLFRLIKWYVTHEHVTRKQKQELRTEKQEDRKRQLALDIAAAEQRLREVNAELGLKEDD